MNFPEYITLCPSHIDYIIEAAKLDLVGPPVERIHVEMRTRLFLWLVIVFNAALLGLAALAKSRHLDTFATAIDKTFLFPDFASRPIAVTVTAGETLICLGLFVPKARRQAMVFALGLSTIFLFYQFWRIHSKIDADCGCFGDLFVLSPLQSILLDAAMIASQSLYLTFMATSPAEGSAHRPQANSFAFVNASIAVVTAAVSILFLIGAMRNQAGAEAGLETKIVPTHTMLQRMIGDNVTEYPLTIIEFGDYQCPPCRSNHLVVRSLMDRYPRRSKLVFHDFPLISLHPLAERAAMIHQAAMRTGFASQVHEEMMHDSLNTALLERLERKFKADRAQDSMRVQQDVQLAKEMGVHQTPTFFLYTNQGQLLLLDSASQIEKYLQNAGERR